MNKSLLSLFLLLFIQFFTDGTSASGQRVISGGEDMQLKELGDSVYIHETWYFLEGTGRFASNGMVVVRDGEALLVDTPMDNEMTERLVKLIDDSLNARVTLFIPGHFHDDCLGGLEFLQRSGVRSVANILTIQKCRELGLPVPSESFSDSLIIDFHGLPVECRFNGPGHSPDNITVWLPGDRILFGGCLIKAMDADGLGNLSDAVPDMWGSTVKKVLQRYGDCRIVIPGHGSPGGKELLLHTIALTERK